MALCEVRKQVWKGVWSKFPYWFTSLSCHVMSLISCISLMHFFEGGKSLVESTWANHACFTWEKQNFWFLEFDSQKSEILSLLIRNQINQFIYVTVPLQVITNNITQLIKPKLSKSATNILSFYKSHRCAYTVTYYTLHNNYCPR